MKRNVYRGEDDGCLFIARGNLEASDCQSCLVKRAERISHNPHIFALLKLLDVIIFVCVVA